ncbi:YicC/YloC family endoribonuclease [Clostridium oryzae]|uniref:YicC family protein n=1 Tax=Clostridium oryzae TaxID=1450648 RepID=A0A1V4IPD6_9CLOT|nr:YicC/YloC family endoribonuclease [Clostridium oryzae]OPJ61749.1 hypothetical protein CLORY_20550 [Clostridium oryzae]
MVSSMTGFGRAAYEVEGKKSFTIEIKSVNHRFLDINVRIPRTIISLEDRVRKLVSENLSRGKIDVFINYNNIEKLGVQAKLNTTLSDSYYQCLLQLKERYNIEEDVSLSLLSKFPDVIYLEEEEENMETIWQEMQIPIIQAIDVLKDMRKAEGEKLHDDILKKCDKIRSDVEKIEDRSKEHILQYKQKLTDRLKEILTDNSVIDENRLNMELALYADRCCIDEEITRIKSHISQISSTVDLTEPIGRKLDFLVQELNREANTIASKSNDLEITRYALNIKNEIEKIREQIQNIE